MSKIRSFLCGLLGCNSFPNKYARSCSAYDQFMKNRLGTTKERAIMIANTLWTDDFNEKNNRFTALWEERVRQRLSRNPPRPFVKLEHIIHFTQENTMQDNKEFLKKIEDTASRINQFNAPIPTERHDAILEELNYLLKEHKNLLLQKPGAQPVNKQALQPFDLEKALAGHPIVMRNSEKARIIGHIQETNECFVYMEDRKGWAVVALNGQYSRVGEESEFDLFMAPPEKIPCVTKVGSQRFGSVEGNHNGSCIPVGREYASHLINICAGYVGSAAADEAVDRIRKFIENGCV